jgi:flagellar export protein FliJ
MKPATLASLLRLRRHVVDEASRHLAACLAAEAAANAAARAQAEEINRQRARAEADTAGDGAVEGFARWYPAARARLRDHADRHDRTQQETARARAQLSAARASLEAVEILRDEARRARRAALQGDEQRQIDEVVSRYPSVRNAS